MIQQKVNQIHLHIQNNKHHITKSYINIILTQPHHPTEEASSQQLVNYYPVKSKPETEVSLLTIVHCKKQFIRRTIRDMLILKQTFYCLVVLTIVLGYQMSATVRITQKTISKGFLAESVIKLLSKLEKSNDLNVNIKFTAILSEFLIKRKC